MIAEVTFGWELRENIKKLPLARQEALAAFLGEEGAETKEAEDGSVYLNLSWYGSYVCDITELMTFGIPFTVKKCFDKTNADLVEAIQRLDKRLQAADNMVHYNQKCHVHVSGLGLLRMREVYVENDCCTDRLNQLLQDGWRIVAACVQPNQRRPDYVLGRAKPQR